MKKIICLVLAVIISASALLLCGCEETAENKNVETAMNGSKNIVENQPAPTDINYSLERYNVIKRAYWVNGQREKAMSLPCGIERPLGYIVLFSNSGAVIEKFIVDGKVSSLNSYLFPANYPQYLYDNGNIFYDNVEISGIDGCYGSNAGGIFFFDVYGNYVEWTGEYLYTDVPVEIEDPVLTIGGNN